MASFPVATKLHVHLGRLAARMAANGSAADLVPISGVIEKEKYLLLVEEELRKERIALTDEQFRRKYREHLHAA